MDVDKYIPISCDFVDVIEHLATLGTTVDIVYLSDGIRKHCKSRIKTWVTQNKEEFVVLELDDLYIRMDKIISLGDSSLSEYNTCGL